MRASRMTAAFLCGAAMGAWSLADEIKVMPGAGALGAALAKAKSGDVVVVGAGEYSESVTVPGGVTLRGEGAEKTTILGSGYAALNCTGAALSISGLTVKGGEKTVRGINTSGSLRVERCRFQGIREAVAMMEAPLSDVVACEFIDCGIGVRAIGAACPTVWGCWFKGGDMGIFAMDGSPYVRNCVFDGTKTGIRLMPHDVQPAIIRNNAFLGCTDAGIEVLSGKSTIFGPSIRNSIFEGGGAAVVGEKSLVGHLSNALIHGAKSPAIRARDGGETVKAGQADLSTDDAGPRIGADGTLTLAKAELATGKGMRLCGEAPGTPGTLGPEAEWRRVGIGATGTLPPVRFGGKTMIANAVGEEYQYLKTTGRGLGSQEMSTAGGKATDTISPRDGKQPANLVFDISRFFGEESVKP